MKTLKLVLQFEDIFFDRFDPELLRIWVDENKGKFLGELNNHGVNAYDVVVEEA